MNRGAGMGGMHVGGASILMIFVSLCLATFATLTMASASASFRLTERVALASDNYFAADSRAEEILSEVSALVRGEPAYIENGLDEMGLHFIPTSPGNGLISYTVPIDTVRALHVELELYGQLLRIMAWRVEVNYTPDTFGGSGLDVWRGE